MIKIMNMFGCLPFYERITSMGLINKIFGTYSQRQIKKIIPTVDEIENLADKYKAMSDAELRSMTDVFKKRLAEGETLDDIPVSYTHLKPCCKCKK